MLKQWSDFFYMTQIYSFEISRTIIGMNIRFLATDRQRIEKMFVFFKIFDFDQKTGENYRFFKKMSVLRKNTCFFEYHSIILAQNCILIQRRSSNGIGPTASENSGPSKLNDIIAAF